MSNALYRGRFAPSPTGLLHAGSLSTAIGSYLEARSRGGEWLLRMEDLDPPREVPGAADDILRTLEAFGFEWDGEVVYQSRRHGLYRAALERLIATGRAYACCCTRKEIAATARRGLDGYVYPGTCRNGCPDGREGRAWRLRVDEGEWTAHDRLQGEHRQDLARDIGDFVLLRADGFWAYQLAVVVDDAEQGVTDIVRGADLLVSTPRQLAVYDALGQSAPGYCHLPVLTNAAGEKLSKQTLAPAISTRDAARQLREALAWLGHVPPADCGSLDELWPWAVANWSLSRVPAGPLQLPLS
ncbi:glutamyl-Q tRNA(Asp) ligase [Chromobacterium violaceum]|uniref:tRNA glutamyl-Q(34) synthetase GluQRS n=1 Tax=Chromobacterium violaceum TaxID=536 RepID=UPI0006534C52|nr:tRNA glutamyl-Q(34) synthetase GluQRS [Chromobacterium violaceum]KMN47722.1 glutamyl-Q tRNA(Asp) ligase [Chromobacterium violaceum]KMN84598.1 glutamyl-Q tRNA(Asp) ligase [Chromobacterium violaceum]KMN89140.1 glutamyl-Q tRNA(Asp) ligase [Chromobacterium violaceum]KMO02708.1 glutamyl-Q tRNA(Asp) ligase [Chromobacterium violaceum]